MKKFLRPDEIADIESGFAENAPKSAQMKATRIIESLGFAFFGDDSPLAPTELTVLLEGLSERAGKDEKRMTEQLLKEFGFIRSSEVKQAAKAERRKPGPKKKSSTNQTDERLRRLLENIRTLLEIPSDTSKIESLEAAYDTLEASDDLLRWHLLVSKVELMTLRRIGGQFGDISPLVEGTEIAPLNLLAALSLNDPKHSESPHDEQNEETEASIYAKISSVLKLDGLAVMDRCLREKESGTGDSNQSLPDNGTSRPEVLTATWNRLRHLNQLFMDTGIAIAKRDIEGLYRLCESGPPLTGILAELRDLFLKITNRQGVHPFQGETLEDFVVATEPTKEGEEFTGGYWDIPRSIQKQNMRKFVVQYQIALGKKRDTAASAKKKKTKQS